MKKFAKILFDVKCNWIGFPPQYRIYVNDELFAERTFNHRGNTYIQEMLQIEAEPGRYRYRLEILPPFNGQFTISGPTIDHGDARVIGPYDFEIS